MATEKEKAISGKGNSDTSIDFPGNEQWEEVGGEEFAQPFRFDAIDDSITGILVRKGEQETDFDGKKKTQNVYTIKALSNGHLYSIFGNADLDNKLGKIALNSKVAITFAAEEAIKGLNPRKLFKVEVAKRPGSAPSVTQTGPKKV